MGLCPGPNDVNPIELLLIQILGLEPLYAVWSPRIENTLRSGVTQAIDIN